MRGPRGEFILRDKLFRDQRTLPGMKDDDILRLGPLLIEAIQDLIPNLTETDPQSIIALNGGRGRSKEVEAELDFLGFVRLFQSSSSKESRLLGYELAKRPPTPSGAAVEVKIASLDSLKNWCA